MTIETEDMPAFRIQTDTGLDSALIYYLAGPMTGLPEYNHPTFKRVTKTLRTRGIIVNSPHEYDESSTPGSKPYEEYIRAGIDLLMECDAIILLPGWASSPGTILELTVALRCKCPVYYYDESNDKFMLMTMSVLD